MNRSGFYTIPRLAAEMGIPEHTLRTWFREGILEPAYWSGNRPYFDHVCVERARKATIERSRAAEARPRYDLTPVS